VRAEPHHPLGYWAEAHFWALIAAIGVFDARAGMPLGSGVGTDFAALHHCVF
jgi:hypothetical protein